MRNIVAAGITRLTCALVHRLQLPTTTHYYSPLLPSTAHYFPRTTAYYLAVRALVPGAEVVQVCRRQARARGTQGTLLYTLYFILLPVTSYYLGQRRGTQGTLLSTFNFVLTTYYSPLQAKYPLPTAHYLLLTIYYPLLQAKYLDFGTIFLLPTTYY